MLKYLERKKAVGSSLGISEDYNEAGPTAQAQQQSGVGAVWGQGQGWEARRRVRASAPCNTATLIKAAVKKVFIQTGPDGKSRKVSYPGHVAEGLRQLRGSW